MATLRTLLSAPVLDLANEVLTTVPLRLRQRVQAFQSLPYIVGTNPFVGRTLEAFTRSADALDALAANGPVKTPEQNAALAQTLQRLVHAHANDVPTLAKGFHQCVKYMTPEEIKLFLDSAIRSRIAVRLFCEQHIAVSQAVQHPDEPHSVVDMTCSPADMVRSCTSFVSEMCDATVGASPACILDGDVDATFACVLLKNSYRASVEHHARTHAAGPIPPVTVTISRPSPMADNSEPTHVGLRIRDEGGGVAPADLDRIFSYAFTTAGRTSTTESDSDDEGGPYAAQHVGGMAAMGDQNETGGGAGSGNVFGEIAGKGMQVGVGTLAGLGYGLPLARLYANFFGGSLELKSLHGHGVDVFLKLRNLHPEVGDIDI
ncbi:branched-chain alpha-ketoacid dehydrogenase [Auriculariales sp. MPI-PUGE-AT-0066]|nr:branched-chain alpha-ketoacid dehydrogenase [Auriculariales sp. MPI-PUGE-AT-0066]